MNLKVLGVLLFLGIGLSSPSLAQFSTRNIKYTSLGLALQGSYFNGDVTGGLRTTRPGLELSLARKVAPRISLGVAAGWLQVMGSDYLNNSLTNPVNQKMYIRNLHFKSTVLSVQGFVQFDIIPNFKEYIKRPVYNVFLKLGLGGFHFEPKTKDSTGTWINLRELKTEGKSYSAYSAMIPVSVGVRYKLASHLDLEVECSYVFTFTDYLDDVSGDYPAVNSTDENAYYSFRSSQATDPQTGRERDLNYIENDLGYTAVENGEAKYYSGYGPGNARGSKDGYDTYIAVSFRLVYIIPQNRVYCPRY